MHNSRVKKGFLSGTFTKISLLGLVWAYLSTEVNCWCGRPLIHIIYLQSLNKNGLPYMQKLVLIRITTTFVGMYIYRVETNYNENIG